jgi:hypothetical protein
MREVYIASSTGPKLLMNISISSIDVGKWLRSHD